MVIFAHSRSCCVLLIQYAIYGVCFGVISFRSYSVGAGVTCRVVVLDIIPKITLEIMLEISLDRLFKMSKLSTLYELYVPSGTHKFPF